MSWQRLYWYKCVRLSPLLAFECTLNHCTFISFHFISYMPRSLHKTISDRAFPIAAARVWNMLPPASPHCYHCRLSSKRWRRNCFADRTTMHTSGNSSTDTSLCDIYWSFVWDLCHHEIRGWWWWWWWWPSHGLWLPPKCFPAEQCLYTTMWNKFWQVNLKFVFLRQMATECCALL